MQTFLELWWVLPVSVVFSTVAIGSGVSGALFFSPFFMLVVGLAPAQAVEAGLFTPGEATWSTRRTALMTNTVAHPELRFSVLWIR